MEDTEDDAELEDEEVGQEELLPFPPLVEVPRDFFVGGSSRVPPFIEFRLPWDGLLLFSLLERLLDDDDDDDALVVDSDWLEGVGELFTGARRRRPIVVALAISCVFTCRDWDSGIHRYLLTDTSTLTSTKITPQRSFTITRNTAMFGTKSLAGAMRSTRVSSEKHLVALLRERRQRRRGDAASLETKEGRNVTRKISYAQLSGGNV